MSPPLAWKCVCVCGACVETLPSTIIAFCVFVRVLCLCSNISVCDKCFLRVCACVCAFGQSQRRLLLREYWEQCRVVSHSSAGVREWRRSLGRAIHQPPHGLSCDKTTRPWCHTPKVTLTPSRVGSRSFQLPKPRGLRLAL